MRTAATLPIPCLLLLLAPTARAEAPPPDQLLATDPSPPSPHLGISAEGVGVLLGDYALRTEWAPHPAHSLVLQLGASRRHGGDALLAELGWTAWPLAGGLEGCFFSVRAGLSWAGPWNGASPSARDVGRLGGEVGWQFLFGELSVALGGGVAGFWAPREGSVWVEPLGRLSLGVVFR